MSKRITIEELQSYLWNSAVLLRTNIDAGAYKQYIFPLLFFKRICDVYDEETAAALEEYGDDAAEFDEDEISKKRGWLILMVFVLKRHSYSKLRILTSFYPSFYLLFYKMNAFGITRIGIGTDQQILL